ncbi:MAG: lipoyl(octanoyl) transferase LipB [Breznakibacter sp.]
MVSYPVHFEDLGVKDYKVVWDYQEQLFDAVVAVKLRNRNQPGKPQPIVGNVLFVEHPHVYTLGKSGEADNLLINGQFLQSIQATYYKINRGGDITYHGPGQLVGYPILDLELMHLSVKQYIDLLEEVIIRTIAEYGIEGGRLYDATGVWLDAQVPGKARKICAIGVRASRYVTMHGFALNVNTNMQYFTYINPCGFVDKGVTSIEKELGRSVPMDEIKSKLKKHAADIFRIDWQ